MKRLGKRSPASRKAGTGLGSSSFGPLSHPAQINPAISGSKKFRFTPTSAANDVLINQQELLTVIVMATSAATSANLFSSVRLRKVEVWAAPAQGGASSSVMVSGFGTGPENRKSDRSMGVTPAHIAWSPAPHSLADLWYSAASPISSNIFYITAPVGAIIDVTLDYVIDCEDSVNAGPVPTGATAGVVYGLPLDGLGGVMPPADYVLLP
jgi:hypothetical protein